MNDVEANLRDEVADVERFVALVFRGRHELAWSSRGGEMRRVYHDAIRKGLVYVYLARIRLARVRSLRVWS